MRKISVLLLLFCLIAVAVPASASYDKVFLSTDKVVVNQSSVQDPTPASTPWVLWIGAGLIGLFLVVLSLIRPKSQRMDYEINVILSVLAWPFVWYCTWGGLTSVDYIVGVGITSTNNTTTMITQHILYSFWVIGFIGVAGCIFAAFVTALLVLQYNLFKDNEAEAVAREPQKSMLKEEQ